MMCNKNLIRILIISNTMNRGGAETFIIKMVRSLSPEGHIFDFYIMGTKGYYDKEILNYGGTIVYGTLKTKNPLKYKKDIKEFLKGKEYKYVYRALAHPMSTLDLYFFKKYCPKAKLIARSTIAKYKNAFSHYLLRPLAKVVPDVKFAPSSEAYTFMFGTKPLFNNVLPNGIDRKLFSFDPQKRVEKRAELCVDDETTMYVHIGRFTYQKNHKFLLTIFKAISERNEKSKLFCIGTGPEMEHIKQMVKSYNLLDNVMLLGERTDISELLMAADLMIFPSFFEGLPNVVIEAQGTGLPVITTNLVTKESNLYDNVKFLSLKNHDIWVEECLKSSSYSIVDREKWSNLFPEELDNKNIAQRFLKLVIGDDNK